MIDKKRRWTWIWHTLRRYKCKKLQFRHELMASDTSKTATRGQSNLTKNASRGAHSPVRGHPRGSEVVPLNSWGRVSY